MTNLGSKNAARQAWEIQRKLPLETLTTLGEIEIRNIAYWRNPPALRIKYMREAEAARKEWPDNEKWIIEQIEELNKWLSH